MNQITNQHDIPDLKRRRSSLLDRWIHDQQNHIPASPCSLNSDSVPSVGTKCNPYLAYPQMSRYSTHSEVGTLHSYDVIDHDEIPEEFLQPDPEPPPPPLSPMLIPSARLRTPPSLRNFRVPFRSTSPSPAPSVVPIVSSNNPSRISLFSRGSTDTPTKQSHSTSPSAFNFHARSSSNVSSMTAGSVTGSNWKWRPSVLGRFSTSPQKSTLKPNKRATPSRPSSASTQTHTSTPSTTTEGETPSTPHKLLFANSFRSRGFPVVTMISSPSLVSQSMSASTDMIESSASASTNALAPKANTIRMPFSPKPTSRSRLAMSVSNHDEVEARPDPTAPHVAYSSNNPRMSLSSLGSSTRNKKKKRLVISGIASTDKKKFDGAKRWCESFGEVSEITRMPNGDLHVNFRDAEVAETVCRVRAKVYISGVGSVYLSWYAGKKRR